VQLILFANEVCSLKINVKLGGINHRIDNMGISKNTMVVGADVTHPNKDSPEECPSMAGLVATYEADYAHYLPSARLQVHNDEVS
jgi:eukaryotic translation initiation factor 2C